MHSYHRICSLVVLGTVLAVMPAAGAVGASIALVYRQTANVQSASGRITVVQGNTFTLQVSTNHKNSQGKDNGQNTLTFTIGQDTDVSGKIAIGADANVTYRQQDGNNIAVSVHIVQQPS
jgi:hypothetical protein